MNEAERQARWAAYLAQFENPELKALREKLEQEAKEAVEETHKFLAEIHREREEAERPSKLAEVVKS